MAKHYNPSISERALRQFNFKSGDSLTNDITGPFAVIPIEPIIRIVRYVVRSATGTSTIYTTPSDKDFYLTGLQLSHSSNSTSDSTSCHISVTIDGIAQRPAYMLKQALTASDKVVSIMLPKPIKVDRNTSITLTLSFTVGADSAVGVIYGYTEEVTAT